LLTSADLKRLFVRNVADWTAFNRRYPRAGGFIQMSAVGFDAAKRHAVLYEGHSCGGARGEGHYHFFEQRGGAWIPTNSGGWEGGGCWWTA